MNRENTSQIETGILLKSGFSVYLIIDNAIANIHYRKKHYLKR